MLRRQRLVDSALFAFALVAGAAFFSNQARQAELPGWAVALGTLGGLAACFALWVRRRWPVAVTVAILPVAVFTSFAAPAGLIAFYTVALHRRLTTVLWVGTIGLTLLSIGYALQAADRPELRTSLWLSLLSIVLRREQAVDVGHADEKQVALAIAQGKPNAEIGAELFMSLGTVKAHVTRVLTKLELDNRVQVALLAHDAGVAERPN
jgi:DNA-binding CsgD family transcriptional regulator